VGLAEVRGSCGRSRGVARRGRTGFGDLLGLAEVRGSCGRSIAGSRKIREVDRLSLVGRAGARGSWGLRARVLRDAWGCS